MIGKRKHIRMYLRRDSGKGDAKYYASCYGKIRRTKKEAQEAASLKGLSAYRCQYCGHYHIGRKK